MTTGEWSQEAPAAPWISPLTSGPIGRAVLKLAGPMLASAMLQNVHSVIDLFWVGRLGPNALASVAMSGTIVMLVFPAIMGLSSGTVALVARAIGAGRMEDAHRVAGQSLTVAVFFGLVSAVVGIFFSHTLIASLNAAPEVVRDGGDYLRILLLGNFTMSLLFIGNSALQGAGDTVRPMLFMTVANLLNLVLDPLLIFGLGPFPEMGVRGAAWATVLAQAGAAIVSVRHLVGGKAKLHVRLSLWKPDWIWIRRILRIGLPGSGQMLSRSLMGLVLMRLVADFGTEAVAAYGTAWRFFIIFLMPAFVLGGTAATMVGQNLGAEKPARARQAAWRCTLYDLVFMAVAVLLIMPGAPLLVRIFNDDPEVVRIGVRLLRIVTPSYLLAAPAIVLGRGLHGAGDTFWPMVATIISLWGLQVPLAIVLSRGPMGIEGIWWAIVAATIAHGVLVTAWFEAGRWQHRRL